MDQYRNGHSLVYERTIRHQLASPLGSNIKNRTITRPKESGFKAVARFQSDGRIWPACSARVSTWSSSVIIAAGPQNDPVYGPYPAHDLPARFHIPGKIGLIQPGQPQATTRRPLEQPQVVVKDSGH